jgi:uncharacterized membrane protein (DUF106 family)
MKAFQQEMMAAQKSGDPKAMLKYREPSRVHENAAGNDDETLSNP